MPGAFDGADDVLALISRGEVVMNPLQQNRMRAMAGYDIFAHAGIPNYPKASPSSKLAGGGIMGSGLGLAAGPTNITVNPSFVLHAENVTFGDQARVWLESDEGVRTNIKILKRETNIQQK